MSRNAGSRLATAQNAGASSGYPEPKDGLKDQARRGKGLYRRYCVGCHGVRGDGNGENAPYLDPKPRDFTLATFKCRSTPTGSLPLDSDLYGTISRGIHASGMPSWNPLTHEQRLELIAYVKTFSPRFREEKLAAPLPVPPEPPASAESVKRGAAIFQDTNCWSCHGKDGRARSLHGRPLPPRLHPWGHRDPCAPRSRPGYSPAARAKSGRDRRVRP